MLFITELLKYESIEKHFVQKTNDQIKMNMTDLELLKTVLSE